MEGLRRFQGPYLLIWSEVVTIIVKFMRFSFGSPVFDDYFTASALMISLIISRDPTNSINNTKGYFRAWASQTIIFFLLLWIKIHNCNKTQQCKNTNNKVHVLSSRTADHPYVDVWKDDTCKKNCKSYLLVRQKTKFNIRYLRPAYYDETNNIVEKTNKRARNIKSMSRIINTMETWIGPNMKREVCDPIWVEIERKSLKSCLYAHRTAMRW